MSKSYGLRRFAKIEFLRKVNFNLLLRMLRPFREYIERKGGAIFTDDVATFPFESLAKILTSPGDDAPVKLFDAFFFIDEMSGDELFDKLYKESLDAGIDFTGYTDLTPCDLAVFVWLENPELLQRLHAGLHLTKARRFETFFSHSIGKLDTTKTAIGNLETALNGYFAEVRKGTGVRVFVFESANETWFLIRHGQPMKREAAIADDGESTGVLFRPEIYDVLYYTHEDGQIHLHTTTVGEKKAYCKLIGAHLFNDETLFVYSRLTAKFSLEPIRRDGHKCLICSDIKGIESIALIEMRFVLNAKRHHYVTHKADCIFQSFEELDEELPTDHENDRASFRVRFKGDKKSRVVTLCVPNIAVFERDSDCGPIYEFLKKRGFIYEAKEGNDEGAILQFKLANGNVRGQSGSDGVLENESRQRVRLAQTVSAANW